MSKELLAQKITSADQWLGLGLGMSVKAISGKVPGDTAHPPWWVLREHARVVAGVYPAHTEVTARLAADLPWTGLHISQEDPAQIAYTVDRANGEADRQIRTTLGRFLMKWYPAMSDEYLQYLVAEHASEVSTEVEILTGDAMVQVYKDGAAGGCMSHEADHWRVLEEHHPAEVYCAPNISMAVTRAADGTINGRSMLYTPSETDKRFIRAYGNPVLVKRLQRLGYKPGKWVGAEFKKIEVDSDGEGSARLVMPYLDGDNTVGSSDRSTVAWVGDKLLSVSRGQADALRMLATRPTATATNTTGYVELSRIPEEAVYLECAISGERFLLWDSVLADVFYQGKVGKAKQELVQTWPVAEHKGKRLRASPETALWAAYYVDTAENREYHGYAKLNQTLYPDLVDWVKEYDTVRLSDGSRALVKDTCKLVKVNEAGSFESAYLHKSEVTKEYMLLAPVDGVKTYIAKASESKVVRTLSGSKVVPGMHDIKRLWDGQWEFSRNCKFHRVYGSVLWTSRKAEVSEHDLRKAVFKGWVESGDLGEALVAARGYAAYGLDESGAHVRLDRAGAKFEDFSRAIAKEIATGRTLFDRIGHLCQMYAEWKAEAEALDYNLPSEQGGSDCTWIAPAEELDEFGLTFSDKLKLRKCEPEEGRWQRWLSHRTSDFVSKEDFVGAITSICLRELTGPKLTELRDFFKSELRKRYDKDVAKLEAPELNEVAEVTPVPEPINEIA